MTAAATLTHIKRPAPAKRPAADDTTVWLKICDLEIEPRAQRPYSEKRAQRYANEFDPDYVGVLQISEREDGRLYIIDGQHRVGAMRILGWDDQRAECKVHRGLTLADEARLFNHYNDFARPTRFDNFMVRITARDPDAVAIDEIVRGIGLCWQMGGEMATKEGRISCVASLEGVYRGLNYSAKTRQPIVLRDVLLLAKGAWGLQRDAFRGEIVQGLGAFLLRYGAKVDKEHLRKRLASADGGALGLIGKARTVRSLEGGAVASGFAKVLVLLYNKGLGQNKLPGWQGEELG
jgi:hypothetical protein